jgi:hypothetical protein
MLQVDACQRRGKLAHIGRGRADKAAQLPETQCVGETGWSCPGTISKPLRIVLLASTRTARLSTVRAFARSARVFTAS